MKIIRKELHEYDYKYKMQLLKENAIEVQTIHSKHKASKIRYYYKACDEMGDNEYLEENIYYNLDSIIYIIWDMLEYYGVIQ